MRRAAASLCLVAALSACALSRGASRGVDAEMPLQASLITKVHRGYLLSVNQPAYVAIFEVVPGVGTSLLYPAAFMRDTPLEGTEFAWESPFVPGRWAYQFTGAFGRARVLEPTYIFMIASREPLALDRIGSSPSGVLRLLSYRGYTALNPYRTMDALATALLPAQDDAGWSTDVLVLWPRSVPGLRGSALARLLTVRCANGRELHVPIDYPYAGCPGDRLSIAASPPKGDSAPKGVKRPRRPSPPGDDGARSADSRPSRPDASPRSGGSRGSSGERSAPRRTEAEPSRGSTAPGSVGPGFRESGTDRSRGKP